VNSLLRSELHLTWAVHCPFDALKEEPPFFNVARFGAMVIVKHDFSKHPVCSLPGVVDLKNALDEHASVFRLTFEFTVV
jgi:hypothetical protein